MSGTSSQISNVQGNFKRFYGDISNLVPAGLPITEMLKFDKRKRVGENYTEAVILNNETGLTLGGNTADVVDINPAVAGAVKQASVTDYQTVLASVVPFQVLSRAAEAGATAFVSASKHIVKNNLRSHASMKESLYLYGQATTKLGALSYETTTYRGFTVTAGAATFTAANGDTIVTVTGGISAGASNTGGYLNRKFIFLGRSFAAHIWAGMEGCPVVEVVVSGSTVAARGKIISVIAEWGLIEVDFVPTAASAQGTHCLGFPGSESNLEIVGINNILNTSGLLFGIDNTKFSLWRATSYDASVSGAAGKLTFAKIQTIVANVVNRSGMEQDLTLLVNPRSWQTLLTEQAAQRHLDSSYKTSEMVNGAEDIVFYSQNGKITIKPTGRVKENEAYLVAPDTWSRFGSAELSFKVPGSGEDELIKPLENQTAYAFRSYSSDCIFCSMPAINCLIFNINDEAAA